MVSTSSVCMGMSGSVMLQRKTAKSAANPPTQASGTLKRMTSGRVKLWKSTTITR